MLKVDRIGYNRGIVMAEKGFMRVKTGKTRAKMRLGIGLEGV
jgi:hypothetical protein